MELAINKLRNDANLTSYWKLEGNSNDEMGLHNGTDTAITYSTANGKFGQGAGFNGTTSVITDGALLTAASGSVSIWINPSTVATTGRPYSDAGGYLYAIIAESGVSGSLKFYIFDTSAHSISATISAGSWIHLVQTWDGTNMRAYINGSIVGTVASGNIGNVTNNFKLGENSAQFFTGAEDDVAVFSRALTDSEILSLYNSSSNMFFNL